MRDRYRESVLVHPELLTVFSTVKRAIASLAVACVCGGPVAGAAYAGPLPPIYQPMPSANRAPGWPTAYGLQHKPPGIASPPLPSYDRLNPSAQRGVVVGFSLVSDERDCDGDGKPDDFNTMPDWVRCEVDEAIALYQAGSEEDRQRAFEQLGEGAKALAGEMDRLAERAADSAGVSAKEEADTRAKVFEQGVGQRVDAIRDEIGTLKESVAGHQGDTRALQSELAFWKWLTGSVGALLFLGIFKDVWQRKLESLGWLTPAEGTRGAQVQAVAAVASPASPDVRRTDGDAETGGG